MRKTKTKPNTITAGSLAELTGLTERRINQLADEQKILRDETAQFPTAETLKKLFSYFRQDGQGSSEYEREKLLLLSSRRKLSEAELKEKDALWMLRSKHDECLHLIARTEWPKRCVFVTRTLPQLLNAKFQEMQMPDETRNALLDFVVESGWTFIRAIEAECEAIAKQMQAELDTKKS